MQKRLKLSLKRETIRSLTTLNQVHGGQLPQDSVNICPGTQFASCDGPSCVGPTCHCQSGVPQSCEATCTGTIITF
jgi:hypothetical protein